ncbi:MAG: glycosyltransferase family protein [Bacteroidales bacterium]
MKAKLYYLLFSIYSSVLLVGLHWFLIRNKKHIAKKDGIAALPYYPKNWPGGEDRIAAWQQHFNTDNISFSVFWCWEATDLKTFLKAQKENNINQAYKINFLLLKNRYRALKHAVFYKTMWTQRALIPLFPYKKSYFEKLICKYHPHTVFDFYDADYESNYRLVMDTVKYAAKVTVASRFLESKFKPLNHNVAFVRYAIKTDKFNTEKKKYNDDKTRIGWMGSPGNARQLTYIKKDLKNIENEFPNVLFTFTCRALPDLGLKRAEINAWGKNDFIYEGWLSSLDIGIVPFLEQSDRIKAKISMKTLEFMANKVALISSPHVHSDKLSHAESFLLAENDTWYANIKLLLEDEKRRKEIAEKGYRIFNKYHTYHHVYPELKKVLLSTV